MAMTDGTPSTPPIGKRVLQRPTTLSGPTAAALARGTARRVAAAAFADPARRSSRRNAACSAACSGPRMIVSNARSCFSLTPWTPRSPEIEPSASAGGAAAPATAQRALQEAAARTARVRPGMREERGMGFLANDDALSHRAHGDGAHRRRDPRRPQGRGAAGVERAGGGAHGPGLVVAQRDADLDGRGGAGADGDAH